MIYFKNKLYVTCEINEVPTITMTNLLGYISVSIGRKYPFPF